MWCHKIDPYWCRLFYRPRGVAMYWLATPGGTWSRRVRNCNGSKINDWRVGMIRMECHTGWALLLNTLLLLLLHYIVNFFIAFFKIGIFYSTLECNLSSNGDKTRKLCDRLPKTVRIERGGLFFRYPEEVDIYFNFSCLVSVSVRLIFFPNDISLRWHW